MMKSIKFVVLLLISNMIYVTAYYKKTYIEDICESTEDVAVWNLGSGNANSSGILKASKHASFLKGLNCTILVQPPLGFGVVLSVRHLDFRPYHWPDCHSFIQITENEKTTKLCGYSDDATEYQSYSTNGKAMELQFFTANNSGSEYFSKVTFTVTAYLNLQYNCAMKMFQCENSRCIWKGLKCDGRNNCGDQSDEYANKLASCGMMSPGVIAGIVVGSVFGFLSLVLISFVCCRRFGSKYIRSQNAAREPALIQPTLNYGSSTSRYNIQESELPQEAHTSARYQDLPPAYKP